MIAEKIILVCLAVIVCYGVYRAFKSFKEEVLEDLFNEE